MTSKNVQSVLGGSRQLCELDTVVGEHSVDAIRNSLDEHVEEVRSRSHIGRFHEFDRSELRVPIDGTKR
jgi:hypothetical protein